MSSDLAYYLIVQRSVIGVCPWCRTFFRLSDCRFIVSRGRDDWLDNVYANEQRLEAASERLNERERELRAVARENGRMEARRLMRKVDTVFAPRGLSVDDAKTIFNPIDFVVFDKLTDTDSVNNIHLLDRKLKLRDRSIQRSIEQCVERGRYEWQTFRVANDGKLVAV